MASSSPDTHTRALPTAWTAQDGLDNVAEVLEAVEAYKKKDVSKGTPSTSWSGDPSCPEHDLYQSSYDSRPSAMRQ